MRIEQTQAPKVCSSLTPSVASSLFQVLVKYIDHSVVRYICRLFVISHERAGSATIAGPVGCKCAHQSYSANQ